MRRLRIAGLLALGLAATAGAATDWQVRTQAEIDALSARGGGRITVPAGRWVTGTLRLRSGVELRLEAGATLVGSLNGDDYKDIETRDGIYPEKSMKVLLFAEDAADIAITGPGTVDGRGPDFFDHAKLTWGFWSKPSAPRPRMLQFERCRKVRLEGTTFRDSPNWTFWLRQCEDVAMDGIRLDGNQMMINNDGIDIDSCRNVILRNSFVRTGDDCISLRAVRGRDSAVASVCENIVISNCTFESQCQAVRVGCPSDDTIRNVVVRDIVYRGRNGIASYHPYGYLRAGDGGYLKLENLLFENWTMTCTEHPVHLEAIAGISLRRLGGMTFRNFKVRTKLPFSLLGTAESPIRGVVFENVEGVVDAENPLETRAVEGLEMRNFRVTGARGAPDGDLAPSGPSWETLAPAPGARTARKGRLAAPLQAEIDRVAAAGGGRVTVGPGVHETGTLYLRSRVELHLSEGAVLRGGSAAEDYDDIVTREGIYPEKSMKALLVCEDAEDVAVTGRGVIDGCGPAFFTGCELRNGHWAKPKAPRPRLVQFARVRGIRFSGVTLRNSPGWTCWLRRCEDVDVDGIRIEGDLRMINNDGIDFDCCRRVRVRGSSFCTGDDCLILRAIRGPGESEIAATCEDVVVEDCRLESRCQGVRLGCPSDGRIRDAVFRRISFTGRNGIVSCNHAGYLRADVRGSLRLSNLLFEDWKMECSGLPVQLMATRGFALGDFGNVTFRNLDVDAKGPFTLLGSFRSPLRDVRLECVRGRIGSVCPLETRAVENLVLDDFAVTSDRGSPTPLKTVRGDSWETVAPPRASSTQKEKRK